MSKSKYWTPEEDDALRQYGATISLPGRTQAAVKLRAEILRKRASVANAGRVFDGEYRVEDCSAGRICGN